MESPEQAIEVEFSPNLREIMYAQCDVTALTDSWDSAKFRQSWPQYVIGTQTQIAHIPLTH